MKTQANLATSSTITAKSIKNKNYHIHNEETQKLSVKTDERTILLLGMVIDR